MCMALQQLGAVKCRCLLLTTLRLSRFNGRRWAPVVDLRARSSVTSHDRPAQHQSTKKRPNQINRAAEAPLNGGACESAASYEACHCRVLCRRAIRGRCRRGREPLASEE